MGSKGRASGKSPRLGSTCAVLLIAAIAIALPAAARSGATANGKDIWKSVGKPADAKAGKKAAIKARHVSAFTLDRSSAAALFAGAPKENKGRKQQGLVVFIPAPDGELQRFAIQETAVMEPKLAARHPEITTYVGEGIDDPRATIRADLTPIGFHASVRSPHGNFYVDPFYERDESVYVSYFTKDAVTDEVFLKKDGGDDEVTALADTLEVPAGPIVKLRTYRLALITDPSYATYFGAANVTAAKVTLVNRVTQIYEDEMAVRLVLINDTDKTNLNTNADALGANGPCGSAPCYTTNATTGVSQLAGGCTGGLLTRNRIVLGQIIGAGNYDVGHIGLGINGGGVASLNSVGGNAKAQGCTGLPNPVGDFFAVDYVAHEIGHQFGGNHTFNGTQSNCGGNKAAPSVEPGSGSSIMAYAGICRQDNLQPHSDPYWSQWSYQEITTFITSTRLAINEVQTVSLRDFDGTDSFQITYGGNTSAPIVRGTNYTTAAIKAAVESVAGGTATVAGFAGGAFNDTGFQITFSGTNAQLNLASIGLSFTGASGFVGETAKGGAVDNGGNAVLDTDNHAPTVTTASEYTIPIQTPFALTGSATDFDGDELTYMWEQKDRGGGAGTALVSNTKLNGPLFRQFGVAAIVSATDTLLTPSPGLNTVGTDPERVFPDLPQILANNTNAVTGTCPAAPPPPTSGGSNVPADVVDCYSEFLPTPAYVGFAGVNAAPAALNFRLTARDNHLGGGGIGSADTRLVLAPTAGPFLVTSQSSAAALSGGSAQAITWNVAGTDLPPVSTSDVKVSLSTDGGLTYPHVLAASTPNDGSESLALPNVSTTKARIKVAAVGNVYFDISETNFAIQAAPVVTNDAPAGGANVEFGSGLDPTVTISATDADSDGSALAAVAAGLPSGMSLEDGSTSDAAARPGARTWTITGDTTAAPGGYPVTVTVTDETGAAGQTTFTINVTDTTPPAVTVPTAIGVEAGSGSGLVVTFVATALDAVDGAVAVTCSPASGSTFPVGATLVTCTATDAHGNTGTGTFTISVGDTTAPALVVPGAIVVDATRPAGATVTFVATAQDLVDGAVTPVCAPASGTTFAVGTTTVRCTATDAHGNASSASFTVTVRGAANQLADLIAASTGVGPGKSLANKARGAAASLAAGRSDVVCSQLDAYLHELRAQTGKKVSVAKAAELGTLVSRIQSAIGC